VNRRHRAPANGQARWHQRTHCHLAWLGGRGGTIDMLRLLGTRRPSTSSDVRPSDSTIPPARSWPTTCSTASTTCPRARLSSCGGKSPFADSMPSSPVRSRQSRATRSRRRLARHEDDPTAAQQAHRADGRMVEPSRGSAWVGAHAHQASPNQATSSGSIPWPHVLAVGAGA